MKKQLTIKEATYALELLGIDKTEEQVKELQEKYNAMMTVQEKYTNVNEALKVRVEKIEKAFNELNITFTSDNVISRAFLNKKQLCQCEDEWSDIYDITISTLDKIIKIFESENQTESSQKLINQWQDEKAFFEEIVANGKLEELKTLNSQLNELWKKQIDFYTEQTRTQNEFYSLPDSGIFEKFFAKRVVSQKKNVAAEEALKKHTDKIEEIKALFREYYVMLVTRDEDTHFAYIVTGENPKFLVSCDGEYEFIPTKALAKIEQIKNAILNNDAITKEHWKDEIGYFLRIDTQKLRERFEKLDEEDKKLYSEYVKAETGKAENE